MATQSQHTGETTRCLVCGKAQQKPLRRGLCDTDYFRFRRAVAGMQPEELQRFEQQLIDDGKLLPAGKRKAVDDVFEAAKRKFLATRTHPKEDHADQPPTILDVLLPGQATAEPQKKPRKRQASQLPKDE